MKKLLAILLFVTSLNAYSQNTVTLPSPTTSVTPSWRVYGSLSDSLRNFWLGIPGNGYNRFYSATEANQRFMRYKYANLQKVHQIYAMGNSILANGIATRKIDSLLGSQWYTVNKAINGQTAAQMSAKFTADVTSHADCEYAIILGGVNDINTNNSTALVIEGYLQSMYTAAHNAGIKVVGVTILPFKTSPVWNSGKQAVVDSVNTWIMNTAVNVDYRVNAYAVFNDPGNPGAMLPAYVSGDGLHPNTTGSIFLGTTIYNNVTWTPNNTAVTLGISKNISLNQSLLSNSSPTFHDLTLASGQPDGNGGVTSGGNLYMPTTTATTGIVYNLAEPAIYFPRYNNTILGLTGLPVGVNGDYNTSIGYGIMRNATNPSYVTALGAFAAGNKTTGTGTFLGYQSGRNNNGTGGIFIGNMAGYFETGNERLFIDNTQRASEADARVKAMIYGVFDTSPGIAGQELHFNARTSVNGNFDAANLFFGVHPSPSYSGIWHTGLTPSGSNFAFATNNTGSSTILNSLGTTTVEGTNEVDLTVGGTIKMAITPTTISFPTITGATSELLKISTSGVIGRAAAGTDYLTPTGSAAGLTSFPTLNQNTTGTASNITAYTINQDLGSANTPTFNASTLGNLYLGVHPTPSFGAIWNTGLTRSGSNYGFATNNTGSATIVNSLGTTTIQGTNEVDLTVNGAVKLSATSAGVTVNGPISASNLLSGTYTPTITNGTNISGNTPVVCHYTRVGDIVTVSGSVSITYTSASASSYFYISLPISSNIGTFTDLSGFGVPNGMASTVVISGEPSGGSADTAGFAFVSGTGSGATFFFNFTYRVI